VVGRHVHLAARATAHGRALIRSGSTGMSIRALQMSLLLAVGVALALPIAVGAQVIPKDKGPKRTIGLFDFLCLSQLPDLTGIERAAGFGEYDQITGDELKRYAPQVPTEKLFAWRYHDHGEEYVLTAARSKPDDAFKKETPAFANSTNTACSLLVPSAHPDNLLGELTRVLGKPHDSTWEEGGLRVYAWSGQRDKLLSHVHYYTPEKTGAIAVLSASVFVKD
jgi:hypothetical protein